MPKDNLIYISHILERAVKIIQYIGDMDEQTFCRDDKTQSAVIRELEVIGEATKLISKDYKSQHNEIPWKLMSGMRDILIHDYEGVNPFRVWDTVIQDIPILIEQLKKVVGEK